MIRYLRLALIPFSLIYGLIIIIRNKCYDRGIFKTTQFDLPVICVGNLAVGGSGKTPVTEYLVRLLADYKIAILSRGYGRETRGFILADDQATAASIGDEPLQYFQKFAGITVAVCEDRLTGIDILKKDHDLIILDDAFQHRKVQAGYQILLFEFDKIMGWQWLLPAGNLREPLSGYKRAHRILITKCPAVIKESDRAFIEGKFSGFSPDRIAYSRIQYHDLQAVFPQALTAPALLATQSTSVFLLTGIANTKPLLKYLRSKYREVLEHQYPDHHKFSRSELHLLVRAFQEHPSSEKLIITTEKDAQRLLDESIKDLLVNLPVFFLPIKVEIQEQDQTTFNKEIQQYVSGTAGNSTIH